MIKKLIVGSLVAAGILLSPYKTAKAEEQAADGGYLFMNGGVSFLVEPSMAKVTSTPESIRNVPVHPDDSWAERGGGAIKNETLYYPMMTFNLETAAGIGIKSGTTDFRVGGNLKYPLFQIPTQSDIQERNYMGASGSEERGTGTALTYYGFNDNLLSGANALVPGIFARITGDSGLFAEYSIDFQKLDIDTGYDRNDKLDSRERFTLANLIKNTVKVGFGNQDSQAFIGYVITERKDTELGKQAEFETPNHFIVGIQARFGGRTK